jgi:hypothetical protein
MRRAALLALAAISCAHARLGDPCVDAADCGDKQTALFCRGGFLSALPCRGPKGCSVASSLDVMCDQSSGAKPGDACADAYRGQAQCASETSYLVCAAGVWAAGLCQQGTRCVVEGTGLICK